MKKILLLAAITTLASMQMFAAGPVSFGVQATGASLNFDDPISKEVYGFGFGGGAHLDINLPIILAIRVQGDFVTFGADQAKFATALAANFPGTQASDFSIEGGRINIISANANAKVNPLPLPVLSPYVTGGVGLASMSVTDATVKFKGNAAQVPGQKSETNVSANLGLGVDLDLLVLKLYLEARYTWIFASGATSTYVPVSLGVTF